MIELLNDIKIKVDEMLAKDPRATQIRDIRKTLKELSQSLGDAIKEYTS